nr:RNA-directed DNA polymerase, eukaryota, reverse transcriptase zinc-binding domain protein [Tanacetum cinerariifolium]
MVWIEIGGLPLNAWTIKTYKRIAGIWGEPLFVDEDPHDNVAMGREFAGWVSDIKDMESTSCNNSEADIFDNHDHEVNDCGFHKVEEGEILKPTRSREDEVVKNTQWSVDKCKAIAKLCNKHKVALLGIQETYSIKIVPYQVKHLWGNFQFDFAASPSSGRSSGLDSIWDPDVFYKLNVFPSENILVIEDMLQNELVLFSILHQPMFSINSSLIVTNGTSLLEVLDFHISDHRPIFLSPSALDFGPIPFKFYNSWLIYKHLHDIVINFWEQHNDTCPNPIVRFEKKMKALKPLFKEWSNNRSSTQSREKE